MQIQPIQLKVEQLKDKLLLEVRPSLKKLKKKENKSILISLDLPNIIRKPKKKKKAAAEPTEETKAEAPAAAGEEEKPKKTKKKKAESNSYY